MIQYIMKQAANESRKCNINENKYKNNGVKNINVFHEILTGRKKTGGYAVYPPAVCTLFILCVQ